MEEPDAPALKRQRGPPQREEEDALLLILAEMRSISHRVAALEGMDAPDVDDPSPHGGGVAPPPPPPMEVGDVDGILDIHAEDSSEDSLYSPRAPSPFDVDEE